MADKPVIITSKDGMRKWSKSAQLQGKTIGLVPTMGYLHEGHLSLVKESRKHADLTVVSIYINPGQFSPSEDLSTYPSDFPSDIEKLKSIPCGVDAVFHPQNLYDYPENSRVGGDRHDQDRNKVVSCVENGESGHETWIRVEKLEKGLCGSTRPVFFRGVATVVAKLFNIVDPDFAVFGKKDYQQWKIIQRMVRDLDFGMKIIGADLVRDEDGLAMSSRNVRLTSEERQKALSINRSLTVAKARAEKKGEAACSSDALKSLVIGSIQDAGGKVDYVEIVDEQNLERVDEIKGRAVIICVAAWFGNVRLVDNIEI
ncbi:hypothetical protein M569_02339, partial [Genlisea aurea]